MKKYLPLFLYSCMVSISTGLASFAVTLKWFSVREMLRSFSVDLLIFALLLLLPPKLALAAIILLFIPLLLLSLTGVLHIAIYKSGISTFSVMSSLETSANEASEFLSEFVTLPNVAVGAGVALCAVLLLVAAVRANRGIIRNKWTVLAAVLIICTCGWFINAKGKRLLVSNPGYVVVSASLSHQRDLKLVQGIREARAGQSYDGIRLLDGLPEAKKTYIFIIGESSNRNHMSLYGYGRPTNPELEKLSPQLEVFTDAVSSSTHTIPSLRQTLFFHQGADDESSVLLESRSIVGLLGRAGFETWWLSNQTANSDGLTGTAVFANDAKHRRFFNKSRTEGHSVSYDEVLLGALEKVLKEDAPQKAVFVHLLGSHLSYHLRYPDNFDFFRSTGDIPEAPHRGEAEKAYVNQYDNSIRYTDHVVSRIIKLARQQGDIAFVVYFSDHGQEVYDTLPIRGQDAKRPSRNMFDIPFIIWLSDEYRQANPQLADIIGSRLQAPFSLDRFADTAAQLSRLTFDGTRPERGLFAPEYFPQQRGIPYGKSYDKLPRLK